MLLEDRALANAEKQADALDGCSRRQRALLPMVGAGGDSTHAIGRLCTAGMDGEPPKRSEIGPGWCAAEIMMIDAPIIAYYNMLRTQRWIGNLSLVVERDFFGQEPLNAVHGPKVGDKLEKQLGRLAEVMLPLQERAARMMMRSLEALRSAPNASRGAPTST